MKTMKTKLKRILAYLGIPVKKNKIPKKYVGVVADYWCLSELSNGEINKAITKVFNDYPYMDAESKGYLQAIYKEGYQHGNSVVGDNIFTDSDHMAFHALRDRFEDHPKVKDGDMNFLSNVSNNDANAMNDILKRDSGIPGYQSDFSYEVYRDNYIDGSDDLSKDLDPPEHIDKEKVQLLSESGFTDGVEYKVDVLAKEALQSIAEERVEVK